MRIESHQALYEPSWRIRRNSPDSTRHTLRWHMGRKEGVKKAGTVANRHISMSQNELRAALFDLLAQRGETFAEFGAVLARTIDADRPPFSRQYIYRLQTGRDAITPDIAAAILVLAAMADGVGDLQAHAHTVQVLAVHDLPAGTVILGRDRACGLAGCRVRFVPASPRQRYCSQQCRAEANKRRRGGRQEGNRP